MNLKNKIASFVILMLCFLNVPAILLAQDSTLSKENYKIYSANLDKETNIENIVKDMEQYDVVLYGEIHDDSVTHYLQNLLLEKMYAQYGNSIALSMEMFCRDNQLILDEYLSSKIKEKYFIREGGVWNNYKDYRPMVEFAKEKEIDVVAANAPWRYVNMVGSKGQEALDSLLSETAKTFMAPLPYDHVSGDYYDKVMEIMSSHSRDDEEPKDTAASKIPPSTFDGQALWDVTMAYSINEYHKKHKDSKIIHLNGKFHSDDYLGIVERLKKYNQKIKTLVISAFPDDTFPDVDFSQYKGLADYIIITDPAVPRTSKKDKKKESPKGKGKK